MFHMSNDSGLFRTREELTDAGWELQGNVFEQGSECYLPLYEAKLFHQYDHRFATFEDASEKALKSGNARAMTPEEKANPDAVVLPRYWVPAEEVARKLDKELSISSLPPPPHIRPAGPSGTRLALRKITNSTNERTGIFAVILPVGLSDSGTLIQVGYWPSEI